MRKLTLLAISLSTGFLCSGTGSCSPHEKSSELSGNSSIPPATGKIPGFPDWAIGPFTRADKNPVITPAAAGFFCPMQQRTIQWEESDTFNPAAAVKDGKIVVLYRAEDNTATGIGSRTSRIGYAETTDGIHMTKRPSPVLYPDDDDFKAMEWRGGCEDPRVVQAPDGSYVMLYTGWNRDNGEGVAKRPRLCVATSSDLVNWTKHGLAFGKAYNGRFGNLTSKSASIVTKLDKGKMVAQKINGKYFMYWGENPMCAATSDNLIDWAPVLDDNNELRTVIKPRAGYFDSRLTECGPPALMTDHGIVLIYNGKNDTGEKGDTRYAGGSYCAGQLLLDKKDPMIVLGRLDKPFFAPEADFEKSGQYPDGTVFTEGLVWFDGKLYMYYGCADSMVALATCDYPLK